MPPDSSSKWTQLHGTGLIGRKGATKKQWGCMKKVLGLLAILPLSAISADWVEIERTTDKAILIDVESP